MTLVKRAETDIFRLKPFTDALANPTNTQGSMGAGLALVVRNHFGEECYNKYLSMCQKKKLRVGDLFRWKSPNGYELFNVPTREHFANPSTEKEIKRALNAIRSAILDTPHYDVVMPMFGYGLHDLDKEVIEKLHINVLGDLPNIIHLSMWPDAFKGSPPKYMLVVGAQNISDKNYVKSKIDAALSKWKLSPKDFEGIASGGLPGIEELVAGKFSSDEKSDSLASDYEIRPIVIGQNTGKYGLTATHMRNLRLADLATHVVVILSKDAKSNAAAQGVIKILKDAHRRSVLNGKEVVIYQH